MNPDAIDGRSSNPDTGLTGISAISLLNSGDSTLVAYVSVEIVGEMSMREHSRQAAPLVALLLGCAAAACASTHTGDLGPSNPNLITTAELERAQDDGIRDLYELIERTRPRWLQIRNPRSLELPTIIAVYHHETRLGGVDVLRGYPLLSVTSVRYLDAAQAMTLAGASAHIEGAIVISTALVRDNDRAR